MAKTAVKRKVIKSDFRTLDDALRSSVSGEALLTIVDEDSGRELTVTEISDAVVAYVFLGEPGKAAEIKSSQPGMSVTGHELAAVSAMSGYSRLLKFHLSSSSTTPADDIDKLVEGFLLVQGVTGIPPGQEIHDQVFTAISQIRFYGDYMNAIRAYMRAMDAKPSASIIQRLYDATVSIARDSATSRARSLFKLLGSLPKIGDASVTPEQFAQARTDELLTAKRSGNYSHSPFFLDYLARKNPDELLKLVREYSSGLTGRDSFRGKTFRDLMRSVDAANRGGIELPSSVAAELPHQIVIGLTVLPYQGGVYETRVLQEARPTFKSGAVKDAIAEGFGFLDSRIRNEGNKVNALSAYHRGASLVQLAEKLGIAFDKADPAVEKLERFKAGITSRYKAGMGRWLAQELSLPLRQ